MPTEAPPENPLATQLQSVSEVLEEEGVPYWADSGTLLGLVRDGEPMPDDKDIDIGVWAEDTKALLATRSRFERQGYEVRVGRYRRVPYVVRFLPHDSQGVEVSVGIHHRHGDHAWRLASYYRENPYRRWGPRFLLAGTFRYPTRNAAQMVSRMGVDKHLLANTWPFTRMIRFGTWWIPLRYLDRFTRHPETGIVIPRPHEKYLEARYGDWRTPRRGWTWHEDDGLVVQAPPDQIIDGPIADAEAAPS